MSLIVLLAILGVGLVGCGSTPATPLALAPTSTSTAELQPSPTPTPLPSSTRAPTQSPTPVPTATKPPTPSPTPMPSFTPTPAPPPISTPTAGEPLPLTLELQINANGHLSQGALLYQSGPPLALLTSLGRTLYAVQESEILWKVQTDGPVYALALPLEDRAAIGDDAGNVTLVHLSGRMIWRHNLGSRVTALQAWQQGLLAGGWDERVTFLSLDGEVLWQADLDDAVGDIAVLPDMAVVATQDGQLTAFDADGAELWHWSETPLSKLGAANNGLQDVILAGTQDGWLVALNLDGSLRWERNPGQDAEGVPIWHIGDIVGDETPEIVVGTGGRQPSVALLSAGGTWLWRNAVPAPVGAITSADLDGDGVREVLVGLANSEIQAYDDQGRLRGSIRAGLAVWGLETPSLEGSEFPTATAGTGTVLVRADVVAWLLTAGEGAIVGSWLNPPPLLSTPPQTLPHGAAQASGPEEAILVFLGDVALGRTMEQQLARYGMAYPWQGLRPLMDEADLATANLESVLTTQGEPWKKSYLIRAHPRWGATLVKAGFDLVTVANNHALDYEQVGLDETLDTLDTLEIMAVGGSQAGEESPRQALFDVKGLRVAILGYAAARWYGSADMPATDRIAWAQPSAVAAEVRAARDQADIVIVLLHAGTEYASEPSQDQIAVAHAAVAAGADLVVGHHPHVTQTVERIDEGLIIYSLGDALFDIPRPAAMEGHLLRIHIGREGLIQAELWPFWIDDAIRPQLLDDGQGNPRFQIVFP